ncbi:MAG: addiction module protein [Haliea sp.]|nr:addiction module protein [Haliea sp.]
MNTSLKQVEAQALSLSAEERAKLAEVMLESLARPTADIEAAWAGIEQRVAAYDRGDITSYPAEMYSREAYPKVNTVKFIAPAANSSGSGLLQ